VCGVARVPTEFEAVKPSSGALGWILGAILIVVIAAVLHFCKWIDIARAVGYSEAAQRKPYLAAEMFLSRLGTKTDVADGLSLLDDLPPTDATLLIAGSRRALSERRLDGLTRWLRRGGHLIVVASAYWDDETQSSSDELLDRYDVKLRRTERADTGSRGDSQLARVVVDLAQIGDATPCDAAGSLATLSFRDTPQPSYASFPGDDYLEYTGDDETGSAANDFGPQLMQIRVGDGRLTAITSTNLWRNRMIGCYDHAHVLRLLVQGSSQLHWLFNTEMPPLPFLLWQRFPEALVLLAICLAAWLWRVVPRRLPVAATAPEPRRSAREHVTGIARFMWQQRRGDILWAAAHDAADPRIKDAAWLAQQTPRLGASADALQELATRSPGRRETRFVSALRALQQLRKNG
jgi:hypothetical protein